MNDWHTTCLGLKRLPRELTAFEIEAFFNFSPAERRVIEERRGPELMLGLALQIGFLRMSGRLLDAIRVVPPALRRHLGHQFNVAAPDLASLRAMYRRRRTLFEHQDVACTVLEFHPLTEAQRRALVRVLRDELSRTTDRQRLLGFARRWLYEHRLLVPRERERASLREARDGPIEFLASFERHGEIVSDSAADRACGQCWAMAQQCLNFRPLPQGHGSLRPTFGPVLRTLGGVGESGPAERRCSLKCR